MLSESAIDALIQPIIDRQETINNYVIKKIANRIRDIGTLSVADINRLKILAQVGADIKEINSTLAKYSGIQVRQIKQIIKTVALDSYLDAKPFYDYRHKYFMPFNKNGELQKITNAIANQTAQSYVNIANTKATGFLVLDKKNPGKLIFKSITNAYKDAIDTAIQSIETGIETYDSAIKRTVAQLARSGIRRVYWDSGYTKRVDSAVRQAIHDGIKALHIEMQKELAKQIDADGWQLSAHPNSAPDHEPIQGHAFTLKEFDKLQNNEDFKDTWGNEFIGLDRVIGQWNCRHWVRAVILAKATKYKPETLEKWKQENAKGHTMSNGKHLTLYECTQHMRQFELKIRDAKEQQMAMKELGDTETAIQYQGKVDSLTRDYNNFCKSCNMSPQKDKIAITGYKRISLKTLQ